MRHPCPFPLLPLDPVVLTVCVFSGTTVTSVAAGFAVTEEELEKLKDEEKQVGRPQSSRQAAAHTVSLPLSRTT